MTASPALQKQQQTGMQLMLYDDPHSEYCAKVKVALHAKGLTWQSLPAKPCGGDTDLDFKQRVPLGKIPALVVKQQQDKGTPEEMVWFEAEVINQWLEEQFPEPALMPKDTISRTWVRLISRFHDLYLEPALRKLYSQVAPMNRDPAAIAAAVAEFTTRLQQLDHLLKQARSQTAMRSYPKSAADLVAQGASLADAMPSISHQPGQIVALDAETSLVDESSGDVANVYAVGCSLTLADCGYPGLLLYAELLWPALGLGQLTYHSVDMVRSWRGTLFADDNVKKVLDELQPAAQEWLQSRLECGV